MKQYILTLSALALPLLFSSCDSGELTRAKAKMLLEEKHGEGVEWTFLQINEPDCYLMDGITCSKHNRGDLIKTARDIARLGEREGYWEIERGPSTYFGESMTIKNPDYFRPGVRPYDENNLRLAFYTWRVGEVTGIRHVEEVSSYQGSQAGCDAIVEFEWDRTPINSIGKMIVEEHREPKTSDCFVEYDDGWRVKKTRSGGASVIRERWWED
nr:hypothetical protein [Henriciella sp.]